MPIVEIIISRDCDPTRKISKRFMPKPSKIIAYCRIFLEVKVMPPWKISERGIPAISRPRIMAKTGAPIIGNNLPKYAAGTAIAKHNAKPCNLLLKKFIVKLLPENVVYCNFKTTRYCK